jgi:tripartite-type tricarboxylate transporter receptor subunit TctC
MNRRALLTFAAAGLIATGLGLPSDAHAQAFPSQPITLVVAWPAGGGSDISMRLVADALSKRVGVPVVVVNKPGAGGAIGHRDIATAKPDGYTIGMLASGGLSVPYLNPQANVYDDYQPIAFFGEDPGAIQASTASGITSLKDFVEKARANPGKIRNGNDQPGGSSFITIAMFEKMMNFKVTRVAYPGYSPTVVALMGGEIDSATAPVPDVIEQHKAGKLKLLGVAAKERHYMAPDIPTFKEQGYDVAVGTWRCIIGPKGIPQDRLQYLESNLLAVMSDPEFQAKARQSGFIVNPADAKTTYARWKSDDEALYPILAEAGLVKARQR